MLRMIGCTIRKASTSPAVSAQITIQAARASGWPTNAAPVTIWCANARASAM